MSGLWLIDGLKARMQWLQARQTLVSANVANANTTGFKPLDLEPFRVGGSGVPLARTNDEHIEAGGQAGGTDIKAGRKFETKPSGNAVELTDEMAKLADIQLDYQAVTQLYTKSLSLLRMAVGGR